MSHAWGLSARRFPQLIASALFVISMQSSNTTHGASMALWGFTPFPYDFTQEAIEKTYDIVDKYGTLFAIHRDDGIPWREAYDDTEFPKKVRKHWDEHVKYRPMGKKVYLGLAPLDTDRTSMAAISEGSRTRRSFLKKNLDSPEVMQAYLNYVRRAVKTFDPDYLNIGIEAGELADRSKSRWEDFEALFEHVRSHIKKENPDTLIGISFGLTSLMKPKVAKRARKIIASSDYVGVSFYPYFSSYKDDAASRPPQQWLEPLNWLREFAHKPIAITETGYATKDATLASPKLYMKGSKQWQQKFLIDLAAIAKRDNYLFVVWFLPIDYEALSKRAGFGEGDAARLWENIGLFDANLQPKPAWQTWQQILQGEIAASAPPIKAKAAKAASSSQQITKATTVERFSFGFSDSSQLFDGSKHDQLSLSNQSPSGSGKSMQWAYKYKSGRFQWAYKAVKSGAISGGTEMELWVKAKQDTYVLVSFEEMSGESFFTVLQVSDDWKSITVPFSDLKRDEKKKKEDGRFQPEKVVGVTIADARGFEGARGNQTVWLASWQVR